MFRMDVYGQPMAGRPRRQKRCLVAGAVDVDMAASPGRAKNVGQCALPSLQPCFQPNGIRSRVQKTCGNGS